MIDKIKKFTVDDKNNLLSKTFYVLPDNPSDKHFSPSQIRKKGYEGYLVLFEFLNSVIDAINENVDLSNEDIEAINDNIATLQSYFSDGIALRAIADKNGNDIVVNYATKILLEDFRLNLLGQIEQLENKISTGIITTKKAERDANGNVISETYETKEDASGKFANSKLYADGKVSDEASARASADADLEARKVNATDIVNGLTDTSTNKPLSANMGKVLKGMIDTINSILSSDDTDLDTLQEIVAYVKDNKSLIDSITVTKVNVSDIIDNLTSEIANKPVSAKQAFILKGMIDALTAIVNTKANSADVYGKTSIDEMLSLKANAEDVYDKGEIDAKIHGMVFADIDEDFDLESENPVQNKVVSKEIEKINYAIMLMKEELFETILSEIDYKIDFATLFAIPETLSDDDGQHSVVFSATQISSVKGHTLIKNQQLKDFSAGSYYWSVTTGTFEYNNGEGLFTLTGDAQYNSGLTVYQTTTVGHIYLLSATIKTSVADTTLRFRQDDSYSDLLHPTNSYKTVYWRHTGEGKSRMFSLLMSSGTSGDTMTVKNCMTIDLTKMFGAGKEPTTIEEFNRLTANIDIDTYDEGTVINTNISAVKSYSQYASYTFTGNENWVVWGSGKRASVAGIPVSLEDPTSGKCDVVTWIVNRGEIYSGANLNAISNTQISNVTNFVVGGNVNVASLTGKTIYYQPLNPSDAEVLMQVNLTTEELNGIGTAQDEKIETQNKTVIGKVDLGTLNYVKDTYEYNEQQCFRFKAQVPDIFLNTSSGTLGNLLCANYTNTTASETYFNSVDKTISLDTNYYVDIYDEAYRNATASEFKTAMSGEYLYFERKTPITLTKDYTAKVDLGTLNWSYVSTSGQERFVVNNAVNNANTKNNEIGNIICPKYQSSTIDNVFSHIKDKTIACANGTIMVYDTSYTDATTFKEAMSGQYLYFETIEKVSTPLPEIGFGEVLLDIERGGNIEVLFEDAPPDLTTTFVVNKAIGD